MAATNEQVQAYVDARIRPIAEKIRALKLAMDDVTSSIDDVYANLTAPGVDWVDGHTDTPPHYLVPSDVLGIHAFVTDIRNEMAAHGQYPVVLNACVRPIEIG